MPMPYRGDLEKVFLARKRGFSTSLFYKKLSLIGNYFATKNTL
jgi:hypothetical protein